MDSKSNNEQISSDLQKKLDMINKTNEELLIIYEQLITERDQLRNDIKKEREITLKIIKGEFTSKEMQEMSQNDSKHNNV